MKTFLPILFLSFLLIACSDQNQSKIVYADQEQQKETVQNSAVNRISDLPVQIDSTSYLLHPVGEFRNYQRGSRYFNYSDSGSGNYSVGWINRSDSFSGDFSNIKFQHIDSDSLTALTDGNLRISSFSFLRALFESAGKEYLLYEVNDADTNSDNSVDQRDINTLYISRIDGQGFRKLSPQQQELIDWKPISNQNRIYFRSIEDTDRNGKFEEKDQLHYFYLNFETDEPAVVEYFPV